jgi:hypothetical protein
MGPTPTSFIHLPAAHEKNCSYNGLKGKTLCPMPEASSRPTAAQQYFDIEMKRTVHG